jgi:starch synthase (maltosyl-transferring)
MTSIPQLASTMSAGPSRVFVEQVAPAVDAGPYAVKRVLGDELRVEADLICDGHDIVAGRLLIRAPGANRWDIVRLQPLVNDRFAATFTLDRQGIWEFTVEGCVDAFATWRRALERKQHGATPEDVVAHLRQGAAMLLAAAARAAEPDREHCSRLPDSSMTRSSGPPKQRPPAAIRCCWRWLLAIPHSNTPDVPDACSSW